jgi:hypothetical protein
MRVSLAAGNASGGARDVVSPHSASIAVAQEPQLGAVVNDSARVSASFELAGKLLTVELRDGLQGEGGEETPAVGRLRASRSGEPRRSEA